MAEINANIEMACQIINSIVKSLDKWGGYELTPSQHNSIKESLEVLNVAPQTPTVQDAIELGQLLLETYPVAKA